VIPESKKGRPAAAHPRLPWCRREGRHRRSNESVPSETWPPLASRHRHRPRVCSSSEYQQSAREIRLATLDCAAHNTFYSSARDLFTRFRSRLQWRPSAPRESAAGPLIRACSVLQTEADAVPESPLQGSVAAPVSAAGQAMYSTALLRCDGAVPATPEVGGRARRSLAGGRKRCCNLRR